MPSINTWDILKSSNSSFKDSYFDKQLNMNGLYKRNEIDVYNKIYRFGRFDPYNALQDTREYLFFTKPDLHIMEQKTGKLNSEIKNIPFFTELKAKYPDIIYQLQSSADPYNNPFCLLLTNMVNSNLDMPSLQSTSIDTATNVFGTSYEYRGSSEASDDNFDFSLEFRDTSHLDVYHFFRAYEEYETLKNHGLVSPMKWYITNRVLHDQIGIYKFLVDADCQTIIYYAYFCGVMFKSLPRDAFSNPNFSEGLTFSIDMKAAFVEDMNPLILRDFNYISKSYRNSNTSKESPLYDFTLGGLNGTPAVCPYISECTDISNRKRYALKWRE